MTLDEKIAEVHGVGYPLIADPTAGYAGKIPGNPRLGIPAVYLADSPVGVGNGSTGVTQWADTAALAATWDTDVAGQYGRAYGAEQAGKGHNVALGPTINILRLPNWGRAPETFSEDPYLTAQQAARKSTASRASMSSRRRSISWPTTRRCSAARSTWWPARRPARRSTSRRSRPRCRPVSARSCAPTTGSAARTRARTPTTSSAPCATPGTSTAW